MAFESSVLKLQQKSFLNWVSSCPIYYSTTWYFSKPCLCCIKLNSSYIFNFEGGQRTEFFSESPANSVGNILRWGGSCFFPLLLDCENFLPAWREAKCRKFIFYTFCFNREKRYFKFFNLQLWFQNVNLRRECYV